MKLISKLSLALVFMALMIPVKGAKFASVNTKEINVRSCGSTKCSIKFKAWKYTPFEMLGLSSDKAWVEVKDFEGYRGWVHKDLLGEQPTLAAKSNINVRVSPGTNSAIAWVVEKGYPLKFVKQQGSWYQVSDDEGTSGWVSSSVVWGFTKYE